MTNKVKIAIDAMGGENSPKKIIEGIEISLKSNQENFFYLYGKKDLLEKEISKRKVIQKYCEIIDAEEGGPMQASFEFNPEITNKPMVSVMTYLPKKYYSQGWPKNKAVHFVVDEIQADSIPPNFASAFLIECLLKGIKIPENLVLFGGMGAGGKLNYAVDKKRCDAPIGECDEDDGPPDCVLDCEGIENINPNEDPTFF